MDLLLHLVRKRMTKAGFLRTISTGLRPKELRVAGDPRARGSSLNRMDLCGMSNDLEFAYRTTLLKRSQSRLLAYKVCASLACFVWCSYSLLYSLFGAIMNYYHCYIWETITGSPIPTNVSKLERKCNTYSSTNDPFFIPFLLLFPLLKLLVNMLFQIQEFVPEKLATPPTLQIVFHVSFPSRMSSSV